jgi:hypothetical protein
MLECIAAGRGGETCILYWREHEDDCVVMVRHGMKVVWAGIWYACIFGRTERSTNIDV